MKCLPYIQGAPDRGSGQPRESNIQFLQLEALDSAQGRFFFKFAQIKIPDLYAKIQEEFGRPKYKHLLGTELQRSEKKLNLKKFLRKKIYLKKVFKASILVSYSESAILYVSSQENRCAISLKPG